MCVLSEKCQLVFVCVKFHSRSELIKCPITSRAWKPISHRMASTRRVASDINLKLQWMLQCYCFISFTIMKKHKKYFGNMLIEMSFYSIWMSTHTCAVSLSVGSGLKVKGSRRKWEVILPYWQFEPLAVDWMWKTSEQTSTTSAKAVFWLTAAIYCLSDCDYLRINLDKFCTWKKYSIPGLTLK